MKKVLITLSVIILAFACKEESKTTTTSRIIPDTVNTIGVLQVDISNNYYPVVTMKRVVKDSLKLTITDSAGGKITQEKKIVQDTSYLVWFYNPILDSLKRPLKSKLNPYADSVKWAWFPADKKFIIHDFDKRWN